MTTFYRSVAEAQLKENPGNRKWQYVLKRLNQAGKDEIQIPETVLKNEIEKLTGVNKIPKGYEAQFGKELN